MNLAVQAVTEPGPATYDVRDKMALALLGCAFVASWTYVFLHPSEGAFAACIGGTGAWSCGYHIICVRDDKVPDAQ